MTRVFLAVSVVLLAGCTQQWTKPGGNPSDFAKDRYDCLQGAQQSQSSFVVGQYTAGGASGMRTNDMLFRACMNSRGYALQTVDHTGKPLNAAPVNTASADAKSNFEAQVNVTCNNPEFATYFAMTPCNSKDIQFRHLALDTKITPEQKAIFPKARAALDNLSKLNQENARKFGGENGRKYADLAQSFDVKSDQNNLDLYNGQITWGAYNKRRREISAEFAASR